MRVKSMLCVVVGVVALTAAIAFGLSGYMNLATSQDLGARGMYFSDHVVWTTLFALVMAGAMLVCAIAAFCVAWCVKLGRRSSQS